MQQPLLGAASTVAIMAISLAFVALFDVPTFLGWVSFAALCFIPMQIVVGIVWGAKPPFAANLSQPARGVALFVVTALVAAVVAPLLVMTVGEGVSPPGPIPSHFVVIAVVFTFWLAIMMGGWPFTAVIRRPVAAGLAVLIASYAITYAAFRVFFDYQFLQGTPVYLDSAPRGRFMAVEALVFCVTHASAMFLVLCFDLWPFTRRPSLMQQPMLGVLFTAVTLVLTTVATAVGFGALGDPMLFLTRVSVPFIFGAILVLTMFENALFASFAQPLKGLLNLGTASVLGIALAAMYGAAAPAIAPTLTAGAPDYTFEIWLANALLGITFPLLVLHAVYFDFWPMRRVRR